MTERLDRIEQSIVDLTESQRRTDAQMQGLIKVMMEFGAKVDSDHRETNSQIQALIDTSKADRAEAERQRKVFTETIQSLVAQLVGRLNEIAERVEEIWSRVNAA